MKFFFLLLLNLSFLSISAQIQIGSDIDGPLEDDNLGNTVSLSSDGTRLAVSGARYSDNPEGVRIYEERDGQWIQIGRGIDVSAGFSSSYTISLSSDGRRVAIGIPNSDTGNIDEESYLSKTGNVIVYEENDGEWIQIGNIITGEEANDYSGNSVSLSSDGSRVAIGASSNDGNGGNSGQVRIYQENSGEWTQIGSDIDGEDAGDKSGWLVSLSADGTRVAISSILNDGEAGARSGHVRIYEENGGLWEQIGSDIDGENYGDASGSAISLSLDGTRVAIGAPENTMNGPRSGHVRIFEERQGEWAMIGNIRGEGTWANMGRSVSLSSDGMRVAIGLEISTNSRYLGRVKIYEDLNSVWTQTCEEIKGEEINDDSGYSISLAADGSRVAIGAPYNDENGNGSGHVRVFGYLTESIEIKDLSTEKNIKIFPNPSSKLINVKIINSSTQDIKTQIVDDLGRIIWKGEEIGAQSIWSKEIEIQASGVYFFIAEVGNKIMTKKIVITGEK